MIEVTADALATHPFLHGMSRDHLAVLAETAADVTFPARHRLFEDGGGANRFWLIQSGHVALDLHVPGQGRMKIEDFEFDGRAVRACCESDPALGYELTRRLARVVAKRLQATRVRLITASSLPASAR